MDKVAAFYSSTLGKKVLMAATGVVLFGFVVVHMLGNLQLYLGAEQLNHYAELLQKNRPLLWSFRAVLLFCVSVHIVAAAQVWWRSRTSRPVKYKVFRPPGVDYAARTMAWSGPIIAAFIVYHLLHLTVGSAHSDFIPGDVYHNVVVTFQSPWVAVTYIVANALLAMHLFHGLWSLFQTLGLDHPKLDPWRRRLAVAVAVVIGAGNISMPLSVLAGIVKL